MIYTISNGFLSASIDSFGAELRSVMSAGGTEYIWQRDSRYWEDSSPVLFPYVARLYNKTYTYRGKQYTMGIHGFAAQSEFDVEDISFDSITFALRENDTTFKQYPFRFGLSITYSLLSTELYVRYNVKNRDDKPMPYALGGHPGFNIPLWNGTSFEDYYLNFNDACSPVRIGFTSENFLSCDDKPYPIEGGQILRLRHHLFDDDAVVLKNTSKTVQLKCNGSNNSITMNFGGFEYFGIWHMPHTDAPYVCLEPWTSLPSRQGIIEEICDKQDMLTLSPGDEHEHIWFLRISEE